MKKIIQKLLNSISNFSFLTLPSGITDILFSIVILVIYYLVFSFISWNINIKEWSGFVRVLYLIFGIVSVVSFLDD